MWKWPIKTSDEDFVRLTEDPPPEARCAKCGHFQSQHLAAPRMCADCAREDRDGALHAFVAIGEPTSIVNQVAVCSQCCGSMMEHPRRWFSDVLQRWQICNGKPVVSGPKINSPSVTSGEPTDTERLDWLEAAVPNGVFRDWLNRQESTLWNGALIDAASRSPLPSPEGP